MRITITLQASMNKQNLIVAIRLDKGQYVHKISILCFDLNCENKERNLQTYSW